MQETAIRGLRDGGHSARLAPLAACTQQKRTATKLARHVSTLARRNDRSFRNFEVDLCAGEVRKGGLRLSGQPFQVLAALLERPGQIVTREELPKRLWPDAFVDVDHSLNTAINWIREVLGDSAVHPRFVDGVDR